MNTATHINLRALRHPLTLASIALLLINDHWLKAAAPSFWTGKLSDFAGLFFFPFLLAALLSAARLPARATFVLALTLTGGWFALMKTTVWANALTRAVLSAVWGGPVSIVFDPTDCWALVMLFPAWLLWCSLERERTPQPPGKLALVALGVAALASVASSPCAFPLSVTRLAADGDTLYIRHNYYEDANTPLVVLASSDDRRTWSTSSNYSETVAKTLITPVVYPVQLCVPENPTVCYRLPDASRIEKSLDSGASWQVDWQIPWGRMLFMQRISQAPLSCLPEPDANLYDLVLVKSTHSYQIVAAMGNQGLVVLEPGKTWRREALSNAEPIPWSAQDWGGLFWYILPEVSTLLIMALTLWLIPSTLLWIEIGWRKRRVLIAAGIGSLLTVAGIGLLIWYLNYLVNLNQSNNSVAIGLSTPIIAIGTSILIFGPWSWAAWLVGLLALGWSWGYSIKHAPNPQAASKLASQITGLALGLLLLGWLPFVLWAFGIIPLYEMALALAAVLIALLLWRTRPKIISLRRQALTPPAV